MSKLKRSMLAGIPLAERPFARVVGDDVRGERIVWFFEPQSTDGKFQTKELINARNNSPPPSTRSKRSSAVRDYVQAASSFAELLALQDGSRNFVILFWTQLRM